MRRLRIEAVLLCTAVPRLRPFGAHTKHFDWNGRWKKFFDEHGDGPISPAEVRNFADGLWNEFLRTVPQGGG
jgi:hypothetical protein